MTLRCGMQLASHLRRRLQAQQPGEGKHQLPVFLQTSNGCSIVSFPILSQGLCHVCPWGRCGLVTALVLSPDSCSFPLACGCGVPLMSPVGEAHIGVGTGGEELSGPTSHGTAMGQQWWGLVKNRNWRNIPSPLYF